MLRFREKASEPKFYPSSLRWRQRNAPTSPWYPWSKPISGTWFTKNSEKMWDSTNPGYFKAEREGKLKPVTSMVSEKLDWLIGGGSCDLVVQHPTTGAQNELDVQGYYRSNGIRPPKPTVPAVPDEALLQEALSRAQTDAWDALTWLAEFRSTLETIIGFRERTDRLYDRFASKVSSRMRGRKAADRADVIASVWLELRYAWRPMLYDMADINEALQRLSKGIEDPLQRAYASFDTTVSNARIHSSNDIVLPGGQIGIAGFRIDSVFEVVATVRAHASAAVQVTTRDILMVDPLVTAWELVPFSFVLDWFVTIGSLLSAFSPFATGQLRYATLAQTVETTWTDTHTVRPYPGYIPVSGSSSSSTRFYQTRDYSREPRNPQPTLAVSVNLDAFKIFDLVALWVAGNSKLLRRIMRHI